MSNDYQVAVIGRGMIGAAAARHLAEAGVHVVLIGAGEPADYATSTGPFASHYDQGRITRISSASPVWAELAARSIERYADMAARSGIEFHDARGLAQASTDTHASIDNAIVRGGKARQVDPTWLRETTGIAISDNHPGATFLRGSARWCDQPSPDGGSPNSSRRASWRTNHRVPCHSGALSARRPDYRMFKRGNR